MAYTLRGRLETRLAATLTPLLAAGVLALFLREWWPLALAALMVGVGVALDVAVYHRALSYQAGWLALPLGALELALVMALVWLAGVPAPLDAALAFYAGSWLLAQVLGHAVFPLARLTYAEDGGELGRAGPILAAAVLAFVAFAGGTAWGTRPPTVHLDAGVHRGPLLLDEAQRIVGERGTVVQGGIVITANDVTVRGVTVMGGTNGIEIESAENVLLDDVTIVDAVEDGIHARQSSITVRDCLVWRLRGELSQGIDISFSSARPPSLIEGCTVVGGAEGIATYMTHAMVRDNKVLGTTQRGISLNEMSMGSVEDNDVHDALGIGIYCGDYSHCEIAGNHVSGTRPDVASQVRSRGGYGIVALYGSTATLDDNELVRNAEDVAAFINSRIVRE
ncbi:MAG: right-handed parallel beta-helix repeat-containing protein [Actinobacteria bacterium]|nr:right-handed parallel beta-helix repeat-containing protein [Actinomycetota bacterium]